MNPLTRDEAMRVLADAPVAHIGLISDGRPYVTPMSFVVDEQKIIFRTVAGKKLDALRLDPKVCIEVSKFDVESGEWASVIVNGTAVELGQGAAGQRAVWKLYDKYAAALGDPLTRGGLQPLPGIPHLIEVSVEDITGMASGTGFAPRTRPGRL